MHLIPFPASICKQSSPNPRGPDGRKPSGGPSQGWTRNVLGSLGSKKNLFRHEFHLILSYAIRVSLDV
jgi:hypothetical protein